MKNRPVIFSGAMVEELWAGNKTVTRRLATSPLKTIEVGDVLWVRECFARVKCWALNPDPDVETMVYRVRDNRTDYGGPWKPSIHMPRSANRMCLKVTKVRFEPLQAITSQECVAEGIARKNTTDGTLYKNYNNGNFELLPKDSFYTLWDSLHGKKEGEAWDDNPEVLAITFTPVRQNVDEYLASIGD